MEENKNQLLNYTTYAGIYLGLFWVFKYLFVIAGNSYRIFNTIGSILSFGTPPLLLFYFLVKYNTCLMQNKMSFWHGGVQFSILLFFFASILESLVVFIHVKWIEPAYISNLYEKMIEMAQTINIGKSFASRLAEQPPPINIFLYHKQCNPGGCFPGFHSLSYCSSHGDAFKKNCKIFNVFFQIDGYISCNTVI